MNKILDRPNSRSELILHPSRLSTSFCKSRLSFVSVIVLKHFCVICNSNLIQNSQAVKKKQCSPQKGYGEKRCEIQGGGQEMAVMVG